MAEISQYGTGSPESTPSSASARTGEWSNDAQELAKLVEVSRRKLRIAGLLPVFAVLASLGVMLPFVLGAREGANENDRSQQAVSEVSGTLPGVIGSNEDVSTALIDLANEVVRLRKATLPPDSDPDCLPQSVTNACGFSVDPTRVVVLFATASSELTPTAKEVLERELRCRWKATQPALMVEGYADQRPWTDNDSLSQRRAVEVRNVVARELKIPEHSIPAEGRGTTKVVEGSPKSPGLACERAAIVSSKKM
jgi:outer membrane protein OmpA-like peptidoglycan-associated protein